MTTAASASSRCNRTSGAALFPAAEPLCPKTTGALNISP